MRKFIFLLNRVELAQLIGRFKIQSILKIFVRIVYAEIFLLKDAISF